MHKLDYDLHRKSNAHYPLYLILTKEFIMEKKRNGASVYIAVLSLFLFSGSTTFMNAAMQTMIDAHPDLAATTIRTIGTLPSVVSTVVMIFVGMFVGKLFSYRFAAVFGSLLIAVGGTLPAFINSNWTMVLAFMSILGVGVGFVGIRNTLIVKFIPEEKQSSYIGYGMVIMNIGAAVAGPVVGYLATRSWSSPFLFNAVAIIPFLIVLFLLPDTDKAEEKAAEENKESVSVEKEKLDWKVFFYPVFQLINVMTLYPLLSGVSTFLAGRGLGDSVVAGTVLTTYTVAGALVGMVVGVLQKKLGRAALGLTTLLTAAGVVIIILAPNMLVVYIGTFIAGFFFNASPSILQFYNGKVAPQSRTAFFSTLIVAAMQLGIFGSNYYINICHSIFGSTTDIESSLIGCIIIYAALGIFSLIVRVSPKDEK